MKFPARYTVPLAVSREPVSQVPIELPAGSSEPESLESIFARLLHRHTEDKAMEGFDTPEEADDFELEDPDYMLDMSPYELPETVPDGPESFEQLDPVPEATDAPIGADNSSQEASDEAGTPDPAEAGE